MKHFTLHGEHPKGIAIETETGQTSWLFIYVFVGKVNNCMLPAYLLLESTRI